MDADALAPGCRKTEQGEGMNIRTMLSAAAAALSLLFGLPVDAAVSEAVKTVNGGALVDPQPGTATGWAFQVTEPISVTALGYYDDPSDGIGLATDHVIELYRESDQVLLGQSVIQGGFTSGYPRNSMYNQNFRYHVILDSRNSYYPPELVPGEVYILSARIDGPSVIMRDAPSITLGDEISLVQSSPGRQADNCVPGESCFPAAGVSTISIGPSFLYDTLEPLPTPGYSRHRVTDSPFYETTPTLGNDGISDYVVYTSRELLNTGMFDQANIFYRRLNSDGSPLGEPVQVTNTLTDDVLNDASGNFIVYVAYDDVYSLTGRIMLYDIATTETRSVGGPGYVRHPKIHGTHIAWLQGPANATEVYLYDISSGEPPVQLIDEASYKSNVEIGNRFVVWASLDNGYDIEFFDFELERRYALTATRYTDEHYPSTEGDWIVWEARDILTPGGRIEAYNGRTGELRIISDEPAASRLPSVSGDIITWESNRDGRDSGDQYPDFDVFGYRISANERFRIDGSPEAQYLNDTFDTLTAFVDRDSTVGEVGTDEDIYVASVNERPVVDPGEDQTVIRGQAATLDGSGSYDPDGHTPLSYLWKVEFAPAASNAQPSDPAAAMTTFVPDVLGFYTITLTVTDSKGLRGGPEWITISTVNAAPVADAGPDQVINQVGETVIFDGSQSYDPDGDDLLKSWAIIQRPPGSTAVLSGNNTDYPTFIADAQGDYLAELTVSDPLGGASIDTVAASFNNLPPVADAGLSRSALVGETVVLDGSGSSDPNDPQGAYPLHYAWSFISEPDGNTAVINQSEQVVTSFVPNVGGLYVVGLTVNDGELGSEPSIIQVQVITSESAATQRVNDIGDSIGTLLPGVFKNANMQSTFNNKLNAVLSAIEDGDYALAHDKLVHDILTKTDGCATSGSPDKNDWIQDCESQAVVYPFVLEAITFLESVIGG